MFNFGITSLSTRLLGVAMAAVLSGSGCESATEKEYANIKPTSGPADFVGGTRLKAVLAESSDGTAVFLHWRDTALGINCQFLPADGGFRCFPDSKQYEQALWTGSHMFADSSCRQPVVASPPTGACGDAIFGTSADCRSGASRFRVGARLPEGTVVYFKSAAGCAPGKFDSPVYATEPVADTMFVGATPVVAASIGAVARVDLHAEDGARMPLGFQDVTGGFRCRPGSTTAGLRCVPTNAAPVTIGFFADAGCTQAAAVELTCGGDRISIPYVLYYNFDNISALHRGGARLSSAFTKPDANSCVADDSKKPAYSVGEAIALSSLAPARTALVKSANGLIQTIDQAADIAMPHFDSVEDGDGECVPSIMGDGSVRCTPRLGSLFEPDFSDAACTRPVWNAGFKRVALASSDGSSCRENGVRLPSIKQVLVAGDSHRGPVYRKYEGAGKCDLIWSETNAKSPYATFSKEVPTGDLVELKITVR